MRPGSVLSFGHRPTSEHEHSLKYRLLFLFLRVLVSGLQTAAASTINAMMENKKANLMPGVKHLRKGGAGGWRDVFTVRESEAFDKLYFEQIEGSGLKMDFGEGLIV